MRLIWSMKIKDYKRLQLDGSSLFILFHFLSPIDQSVQWHCSLKIFDFHSNDIAKQCYWNGIALSVPGGTNIKGQKTMPLEWKSKIFKLRWSHPSTPLSPRGIRGNDGTSAILKDDAWDGIALQ